MTLEVLTRLRLPIVPVEPDEVARKADLTGMGVFWLERQGDALLYVTADPALLPPPFELEGGNLYYFRQRV